MDPITITGDQLEKVVQDVMQRQADALCQFLADLRQGLTDAKAEVETKMVTVDADDTDPGGGGAQKAPSPRRQKNALYARSFVGPNGKLYCYQKMPDGSRCPKKATRIDPGDEKRYCKQHAPKRAIGLRTERARELGLAEA